RSVPPGLRVCGWFVSLFDPVHAALTSPTATIADSTSFGALLRDLPLPTLSVIVPASPRLTGSGGRGRMPARQVPPQPRLLARLSGWPSRFPSAMRLLSDTF